MEIRDIGILSPGDMGQAIAQRLLEAGYRVHAALDGRSERTHQLAAEVGLHDCRSVVELVRTCDLVISVTDPGEALNVATALADALRTTGRQIAVADVNAISPAKARREAELIEHAGGRFIDGGIIGPPPRGDRARPRIYFSGADAALLDQIRHPNLQVRVLSDRVGDASALKMCYAALTKGVTAITTELLVAANKLGVEEAVAAELRESRPDVWEWQMGNLGSMPSRSRRWVPEMQEIARTFDELGLTPQIFDGAAELYAMIATTPIGQETPEQVRASRRPGLEVTRSIAESI